MGGGDKPLDAGNGLICASFARASGAWLSLARAHPQVGFVELTGAAPFDESWRGKSELVRRYRAGLADESSAWLRFGGMPRGTDVDWAWHAQPGADAIEQRLRLRRPADVGQASVRLVFDARLGPPPLAMITEVGPPQPPAPTPNRLSASATTLRLLAPDLETEATIGVEPGRAAVLAGGWRVAGERAELSLSWPPGEMVIELVVNCRLSVEGSPPGEGPAREEAGRLREPVAGVHVRPELRPALERIRRGALDYVQSCTALRVAPGRVAIVTDHRLLPLSWTRDAYFQALLLLRAGETERVADHLRWLWLDCRRPNGWWARSHHADGRRKDEVYQVDQQLYPLLELADYRQATGLLPEIDDELPAAAAWDRLVAGVLDPLIGRLASEGLLATDENAADDPAGLPYLLANQILGWHAFRRLAELTGELSVGRGLDGLAERLRSVTLAAFAVAGPDGPLWAYAIDARGRSELYHDANDLATALAPAWGFCSRDDPHWRSTVGFAFSPRNPGYAVGPYGGLGSRHTPGVWPLGLAQEWVARSLAGDQPAAESALRRLLSCAFSDGALPEASDPRSGRALARHWFAWPGALVGALLPD